MSTGLEHARALLAGALGLQPDRIADNATVRDVEGWDSLGHMRIVAAIETRTGHVLSAEEILGLSSLPDIAALLRVRTEPAPGRTESRQDPGRPPAVDRHEGEPG